MFDLRRVTNVWRRLDVTARDTPFALVFAAVSLGADLDTYGTQVGGLPHRPMDAVAVVAILLQCLPLAVRRRWPAAGLPLVAAGFAVDQLCGYHTLAGTALAIAVLSAGAHLERLRRTTLVAGTVGYLLLAVGLDLRGGTEGIAGYVTFYLGLCLAWGIGSWLRLSRAAEQVRRRQLAETTRTAERTRIARELHDVVTHHVTAMVLQAEAARYLDADRLDQTLTSVAETGRLAITDLRQLLDLLDPGPAPALDALPTLVDRTRLAGQPVRFTEVGAPTDTGEAAGVTAYRVVQEALTNALKYAHGNSTTVHVRHGERDITVEVGTDGPPTAASVPGGSGRGLSGLRERVDVLGGEFSSEHRDGGGFVVRARIPAGGRR
ncbi:two-component sensor histidine kinase [Actinophytocola xinjiangensis]|uniref:histidine kinase n=1 Tax=Actinophytocola xinjiangensis TaxID=485602 RepID=A0A7Z0WE78_9PSEU|nr:histidine kinase [Actinophytocola xinjiangensis]OLF05276.1 two-component sensor histidine kinase [Actinophytocola xinjiangensis]